MSMSFIALPPSSVWLQSVDPETVQEVHYQMIIADYIQWLLASGVPDHNIAQPDSYFQSGDLQLYSNVVSWWPKDAPAQYAPPTLFTLLQSIQLPTPETVRTFRSELEWHVERCKSWMQGQRMNVDNPNESKEERTARLNRERVARHRLRRAKETDDPELNALLAAAKATDENATAGKRWLRGEIQQAKLDMEAAIAQARLVRSERVARAEALVAEAERAAVQARDALNNYRIKN
jgi:hypothetical protein